MPRYIDAEPLKSDIKPVQIIINENTTVGVRSPNIEEIKRIIDNQPTADVQEVKHGKWIEDEKMRRDDGEIYDYCCSRCRGLAGKDDYDNHAILSAYCPHCGAKMDGK